MEATEETGEWRTQPSDASGRFVAVFFAHTLGDSG